VCEGIGGLVVSLPHHTFHPSEQKLFKKIISFEREIGCELRIKFSSSFRKISCETKGELLNPDRLKLIESRGYAVAFSEWLSFLLFAALHSLM